MSYKESVGKLRKRISNIFRGGKVEFAYGHLLVLHNQEEPLLNAWSQFNFYFHRIFENREANNPDVKTNIHSTKPSYTGIYLCACMFAQSISTNIHSLTPSRTDIYPKLCMFLHFSASLWKL